MNSEVKICDIEKIVEIYNLFPENVKKDIHDLSIKISDKNNSSETNVLYNIIRYRCPKINFFHKNFPFNDYTKFYAENSLGDRLYLLKFIGISKKQNVFLTYSVKKEEKKPSNEELLNLKNYEYKNSNGRKKFRVLKWDSDKNINNEIRGWRECLENNIVCPDVELSYKFCGLTCISMKILSKIKYDNVKNFVNIGVQMLNVLQKFHKFGCHSDIKPDNIMCERVENNQRKTYKNIYYLIDMGGVSLERLEHGYKRRGWTDQYVLQPVERKKDNIITPKIDLMELGVTLNLIYNECNGIKVDRKDYKIIKTNSPIHEFIECIMSYDTVNDEIYDQLKLILLKNI